MCGLAVWARALACCVPLPLLTVLCSLGLFIAEARALELTWTAPDACPGQADVKQRIDGLLEAPGKPVASSAQSTSASAKLTSTRGGYKLVLTLHGEGVEGTRTLTGSDCAELAETAAFLIAVAIDPTLPGAVPPSPEPAPQPAPAPATPEPPPAPAVPRRPATREVSLPFSLTLSGFGGLWSAGLPGLQAQAGGSVGVAVGRVLLEFRGANQFLAQQSLRWRSELEPALREGAIQSRSVLFELAACHLWGSRFFAGPCGSVALIRSFARGRYFEDPRYTTMFWGTAALSAHAGIWVNRWFAPFIDGGVGVAIAARPSLAVRESSEIVGEPTVANKFVPYGRLGVRFRWQPTRTVALP